jgi:hypothetical protein
MSALSELGTHVMDADVVRLPEIVGLLRRAARELSMLVEFPTLPGEVHHLDEALHAVHRALVELEQLGQ